MYTGTLINITKIRNTGKAKSRCTYLYILIGIYMYAFWAIYTYSGRYTRCYCTHSGKGFLPQGIWRCNDETPPIPGQRHASPYLCGNPDFFVSYSLGEITHAQHTTAHSKTAHGTTETENRNYLKYTLKKTETRNFFNDKGTRHFFF